MEQSNKAETHESLSIKLEEKRGQISELEAKIQGYKSIAPEQHSLDKPAEDGADELDAFMSSLKRDIKPANMVKMEQDLLDLRKVCFFT
jgi:hypothetical protein